MKEGEWDEMQRSALERVVANLKKLRELLEGGAA